MTTPQSIIDLIDAGLARGNGGITQPIEQVQCGRQGCKTEAVAGHSFCRDCLAWLRFETDDDPLEAVVVELTITVPDGSVEPEDEYYAWVAAMCGYA